MTSSTTRNVLDSHPSIDASLEDFEAHNFSPTYRDEFQYSEPGSHYNDTSPSMSSRRSTSPPAWRKAGSGWFKHPPLLQPSIASRSKDPSPEYYSADEESEAGEGDTTLGISPAKIPLPESPVCGRSPSPTPEPFADAYTTSTPASKVNPFRASPPLLALEEEQEAQTPTQGNYFRFSTSLDVIQRTEPIEAAINWTRETIDHITRSWWVMLRYALIVALLAWLISSLTRLPDGEEVPDVVKVAKMAESLVPSIHSSQRSTADISNLHDTGNAVWDLSESIRISNMSGAPGIVRQLDELSDSVKNLAMELSSFFANLDSDVDSIINVVEWAGQQLEGLSDSPTSTLDTVWTNTHTLLSTIGVPVDHKVVQSLLGKTYSQRSRATLARTFNEFLGVLEESINNELNWAIHLSGLVDGIEGQFKNLRRSTVREEDQQERLESEFLGSLWSAVIGKNSNRVRKFQKNRELLSSVFARTTDNKKYLTDHRTVLLGLKSALEVLRKRLITPQLHNSNTTQSIEQQLKGLNGVYTTLKEARDNRRQAVARHGFGRRDSGVHGIDAGRLP
ncbi:hypothetical protein AMS68_004937 [Peltaster fructicola]|uniref:Uncharacterized protein n=1 Tax=Peltaster fructicola TaxID=286661 RepID=A0A6H0XYC7_9PEZI|nr:hypothetical protein AMS68_004937 [Peltaster fructicola]